MIKKPRWLLFFCAFVAMQGDGLSSAQAGGEDDEVREYGDRQERKHTRHRAQHGRIAAKRQHRKHDHERLRKYYLSKRKILPYSRILRKVEHLIKGEIIESEFSTEYGKPVYEIKYITPNGVVLELYINARTGRVFKKEQY